jgi:ZIP family zinc transporter
MVALDAYAFVFVAGLITALATGIGALPFLFFETISDRRNVALWGFAGIMLAASSSSSSRTTC